MDSLLLLSTSPRARRAAARPVRLALGRVARLARALALLLACAGGAAAAEDGGAVIPLNDYRALIHEAVAEIDATWQAAATEEGTGAEYIEKMGATLARVRRLVPVNESVRWDGGVVRVNNSWLEAEAQAFERLPAGSLERAQVLARVQERLMALEERLNELGGGGATAAGATKEQEKARLEAVLRRKEFDTTPPEKGWLARRWEDFKRRWNDLFGGGSSPGRTSWLSLVAMVLVFGAAGALLGYILWKFLPFFARRREERLGLQERGARVVLGEKLAPGQTAADILAEAEALARKGELRAAIRKGYVALLCELGDRKVITLAQHKTNHDYLRAVREKRPLLKEMQKLTASFENHWYGFAPATPEDWTAFRNGYQQTLKTASLLSDE
ncbi:MAG TPA: DUF4129 domain-containing protein [Pyrinomonadaceae bacterium]|nr:DUF4129 domain-containing protein [Pyrinomonadaceae bacterium]